MARQTAHVFSLAGRYQVLELLAKGGMAEVYLARLGELSGFQRLVVVKRILPHLAADEEFVGMFLDEARIAASLDHPNVIHIVEVGRAGDEYFMAMELVQGLSLGDMVKAPVEKRPPARIAALVAAQVAAGLHHAHTSTDADGSARHIVHRDVSPQNILVSFDGAVKVIDFGIARAWGRVTSTVQGSMKGKLGYMAPEQARGETVDARTDVFALGVVLWEALTGERLFRRETELAAMRAILDEPVPLLDNAPAALTDIVARALEKDPARRFSSALAMQEALEAYLRDAGPVNVSELTRFMHDTYPERESEWKKRVKDALGLTQTLSGRERITGEMAVAAAAARTRETVVDPDQPATRLERPVVAPPPPRTRARFGFWVVLAALAFGSGVTALIMRGPRVSVRALPPTPIARPHIELLPAPPPAPAPVPTLVVVPEPTPEPTPKNVVTPSKKKRPPRDNGPRLRPNPF